MPKNTFVVIEVTDDAGDDGDAGYGTLGNYVGSITAVNVTDAADKLIAWQHKLQEPTSVDADEAEEEKFEITTQFHRLNTPYVTVKYYEPGVDSELCGTSKFFLIEQTIIGD